MGDDPNEVRSTEIQLRLSSLPHESNQETSLPVTFSERALSQWNQGQWWLGPLGIVVGLSGLALAAIA